MQPRFFLALIVSTSILCAAPPVWWPNSGTQQDKSLNYAPANLGQLKNMAKAAKLHLDTTVVGGAGTGVNAVVAGFAPDNGTSYSQAEIYENYGPVNLGQLKAVAKPFYDRLKASGVDTKAYLRAHGFPSNWAFDYPWNPSTALAVNYSPANVGQLKAVFNFDLTSFDRNHDEIEDAWMATHFAGITTNIGPSQDYDGDGVTNLEEFLNGSNPKEMDSDYDGQSDWQEIADGTNPSDPASVRQVRLGYWPMSSSALLGEKGNTPLQAVSVEMANGWLGNGISVGYTGDARVRYRDTEADGEANINFRKGTIRFWFKPNWQTAGSGTPFTSSPLIACGVRTTNATDYYWALTIEPGGNTMKFIVQDGSGNTVERFSATVNLSYSTWYQIALVYGPTSSKLYINGAQVGSTGAGSTVVPSSTVRTQGFSVGTNRTGGDRVFGTIDEFETFNYELTAGEISANYAAQAALGPDTDGDGMPQSWETTHFAGITTNNGANDDYDGDGLTNLEEFQHGTNPKDVDSDYDGASDRQEIVDGTNPNDAASVLARRLNQFRMNTTAWFGSNGVEPLQASSGLIVEPGRRGKGLSVYYQGVNQSLRYRDVETSGNANINFLKGSIRLWFKPYWNSNGSGTPANSSPLIACGVKTANATDYFWALTLDSGGNTMKFIIQDGSGNTVERLSVPSLNFLYNNWYQIVLVYSPSSSKLYINGALRVTGSGSTFVPPTAVRSQGFSVGTNRSGNDRVFGNIDELETFNYELSASEVSADYAKQTTLGIDSNDNGLPDSWDTLHFGGSTTNIGSYNDFDGDGLTNLEEYTSNTNPSDSDSDYDGCSDDQELAAGTDPLDATSFTPRQLAQWKFESEDLATVEGSAPAAIVDPSGTIWATSSLLGRGLQVTGKGSDAGGTATSRVTYKQTGAGGSPNVNFRRGTISLWVKPNWSSATGTGGPRSDGRIIECGTWNLTTPTGLWALHFNPDGTSLVVVSQNAGGTFRNESSAINWNANTWHHVAVTYGPTATKLYVDGVEKISAGPQTVFPPANIRTEGIRFGSNVAGAERADVTIDEITTYNYELAASEIQAEYAKMIAAGVDTDGDQLPDAWETQQFGSLSQTGSGDTDHDGLTNVREFELGLSPVNSDTDWDGNSDSQEIADGTDPLNFNSFIRRRIASFDFQTASLKGKQGQVPTSTAGVQQVAGIKGKGVRINEVGDLLAYSRTRADGAPNIALKRGTVSMWFKPEWASSADPQSLCRFIELGSWSGDRSVALWFLMYHHEWNAFLFGQNSGNPASYRELITGDLSGAWAANTWHQVVITYTPSVRKLYLDGALIKTDLGLIDLPFDLSELDSTGIKIGTDSQQPIKGTIDELQCYNYELSAAEIASSYEDCLDTDNNGLSDKWERYYFGDIGQSSSGTTSSQGDLPLEDIYANDLDPNESSTVGDNIPDAWKVDFGFDPNDADLANQDPDADGLSNADEFDVGTDPLIADTDGDGWEDGDDMNPKTVNPADLSYGYVYQSSGNVKNAVVTWSPALNPPNGYRIERKINSNPWQQVAEVPGTATSFTSQGLLANRHYQYRVTAYNNGEGGERAWSRGYTMHYEISNVLRLSTKSVYNLRLQPGFPQLTPVASGPKKYYLKYDAVYEVNSTHTSPAHGLVTTRHQKHTKTVTRKPSEFREESIVSNKYLATSDGATTVDNWENIKVVDQKEYKGSPIDSYYVYFELGRFSSPFLTSSTTENSWYESLYEREMVSSHWGAPKWTGNMYDLWDAVYTHRGHEEYERKTRSSPNPEHVIYGNFIRNPDNTITGQETYDGVVHSYKLPPETDMSIDFPDYDWDKWETIEDDKLETEFTESDADSSETTTCTILLEDEYPALEFAQDVIDDMADYPASWSEEFVPHSGYWWEGFGWILEARRHMDRRENDFYVSKCKYRISASPSVPLTVKWYEIFIPEDDLLTENIDESKNVEILRTRTMDLGEDENVSPEYEIADATTTNRNGRYAIQIDPARIDVAELGNGEKNIADQDSNPGRVVLINDGDVDNDGIPDYADGFNLDPSDPSDDEISNWYVNSFVLATLNVSVFDYDQARIKITYPASNPSSVVKDAKGNYKLPSTGKIRIWTKGANEARNPQPLKNGGDFVQSGVEYTWDEIVNSALYVEAVGLSTSVADIPIKVEVKVNNTIGYLSSDQARFTASNITLKGYEYNDPSPKVNPMFMSSHLKNFDRRVPLRSGPISPFQTYQVEIQDPRGNLAKMSVGMESLPLTRSGNRWVSPKFIGVQPLASVNFSKAPSYRVPMAGPDLYLEYNSWEWFKFRRAETPGVLEQEVFKRVNEAQQAIKATFVPDSNPGGFGKKVHEWISDFYRDKDGWLIDVFFDNDTGEIVSIGKTPPGGTSGTTQVDLIAVEKGYRPQLDAPIDRTKIIRIFDIKTGASLSIPDMREFLGRVRKVTGVDEIALPQTLERWNYAKGDWAPNTRALRYSKFVRYAPAIAAGAVLFTLGQSQAAVDRAMESASDYREAVKFGSATDVQVAKLELFVSLATVIDMYSVDTVDSGLNKMALILWLQSEDGAVFDPDEDEINYQSNPELFE